MKRHICLVIMVLTNSFCFAQQTSFKNEKNNKKWTIENSISVRSFSENEIEKSPIFRSPDGLYFYFISEVRDLKKDRNINKLIVFSTKDVLSELNNKKRNNNSVLKPLKEIELSSASNYQPIYNSEWTKDSRSILFAGADMNDSINLYVFNVSDGALKILNSKKHNGELNYPTIINLNDDASTIIFSLDNYSIQGESPLLESYPNFPVDVEDRKFYEFIIGMGNKRDINTYLYRKGKVSRLPEFNSIRSWLSPDGSCLILIQQKEREQPSALQSIVAVNLENGSNKVVEPLMMNDGTIISDVSWSKKADKFFVTFTNYKNKSSRIEVYKKEGENWIKDSTQKVDNMISSKKIKLLDELKVFVRENINTPPMIFASNGKVETCLTEPDTSLQDVYIAPTKTIKWKSSTGKEYTGGLTLPDGFEKLKPLPLVIDVYKYNEKVFSPDGPLSESGYAMQPLVANGFAVLQIDLAMYDLEDEYGNWPSPKLKEHMYEEGAKYIEKIESAVEMLSGDGLIDPNRVGLVGFSRGGFENLYAITHPKKIKFAAAIAYDSYTGSFFDYLANPNYPYSTSESEEIYKGAFWKYKKVWLEQEPIFNVDRVITPFLYTLHGYNSINTLKVKLYQLYDLLSSFRLNRKPLEFLIYPKSMHNIYRPNERYTTITTTVDWMNFWLQGKEDPDQSKAEKYVRWRELKKMQEAVLKEKAEEENRKKQ